MTTLQRIIIILMCVLGTQLTRWLPFLVFSSDKPTPKFVTYLGKALPGAVFGMLVVYCLKNVNILSGNHALPELIGIAVTSLVHIWKKNFFFSIIAGTAVYMLLINLVF